jgi:hypothetical protein
VTNVVAGTLAHFPLKILRADQNLFHWKTRIVDLFHWKTQIVDLFHWKTGTVDLFHWKTGIVDLFHWKTRIDVFGGNISFRF